MSKIKFHDVRYRQGFLEVVPGIHPDHINVEVWNIDPAIDVSGPSLQLESASLRDKDVIGNTEIELSVEQAVALVELLQQAIREIQARQSPSSAS